MQCAFATSQNDTTFWFAAPEVSASEGDNPIYLRFLSGSDPSTVTITQPANGGFAPIILNLGSNDADSVDLSPFLASIESPGADVVSNNGLKITATSAVTAFYELNASSNKEMFSLKGAKGLGTNFYTPFQKFWNNSVVTPATFSSIDVVASEDNTTVLITPRTTVVGHNSGITYSVVLMEGQTYSVRDVDVNASTSLSGTIVSSDKPISVTLFSGALDNAGCTSTMGDQITSTDYIGQDFIVHKGNAIGDRIYILATENATSINIENSTTTTTLINWSETYEYILTDNINYIHTSKPSYVWHASGNGCKLAGAQVPNLFCAGRNESSFTRSSSDSLSVLLYTRTGYENDFQLNGSNALVPSSAFSTVPGTGGEFQVALITYNTTDVPLNSYNNITNSGDIFGMALLNGSHTNGSKYAYISEFNSSPYVTAGLDDTICANTTLALNGAVVGGSVTGYWSGTGFGTFELDADSITNTYIPSDLDTIISPIELILTSTGPCPVQRDTIELVVAPSPIVNASADQTVCGNNATITLNGSVSGGASTGDWSSLGSGTFTPGISTLNAVYTPSPADTLAGSVTLILTATNYGNCNVVTDTMVVTITTAPTVDTGVDTTWVCGNNANVNLSGSVAGPTTSGKWTTSGSGLFIPDNLVLNTTYQPSASDINAGSITLYLESTNNGTCSVSMDSMIVMFTAIPIVEAGVNIVACINDPVVNLAGNVSGPTSTGGWIGGTGFYSIDSSDLNAVYTASTAEINAGTVTLTLESTNNLTCNAENDFVIIDFVSAPFANFGFTEVCLGESTNFTDFSLPGYGSITNWSWDFSDSNASSNQNNTHTYTGPGIYDVELIVTTNIGCRDTVVKPVNVYELPNAAFFYDINCSAGQITIDFTDSSYSANDTINYWFYDFGGQGNAAAQHPTQLFVGSGNFIISQIVSTTHGCVDTIVEVINIPERPEAGFYYNTSNGQNIGAEFTFIDTSLNAINYYWTFGDNNTSTNQDPSNIYWSNGTYVVTQYVTGTLGCEDSTSVLITINTVTNEINTLIPNAISPNGDGKNDVWKLEFVSLLYPEARVEIYNRWGQQLFSSQGYSSPWDGTYNNELVPDGTYYYVIDLNDPNEPEPFKGAILVLKSINN